MYTCTCMMSYETKGDKFTRFRCVSCTGQMKRCSLFPLLSPFVCVTRSRVCLLRCPSFLPRITSILTTNSFVMEGQGIQSLANSSSPLAVWEKEDKVDGQVNNINPNEKTDTDAIEEKPVTDESSNQKNPNVTIDSTSADSDTDVWDDRLLVKEYEAAAKKVEAALKAKSNPPSKETPTSDKKSPHSASNKKMSPSLKTSLSSPTTSSFSTPSSFSTTCGKKNNKSSKGKVEFTSRILTGTAFTPNTGKYCRATYTEDGKDYEAVIVDSYPSAGSCLVRYIGYNNEEFISTSSLKESLGEEARRKQEAEALAADQDIEEDSARGDSSTPPPSAQKGKGAMRGRSSNWSQEKTGQQQTQFPTDIPFPPPPPTLSFLQSGRRTEEDEVLASMLMSWYMSGYHTGYYQAMKKYKKNED